MKVSNTPSVALYGTNPLSLILGRACALRELSLLAVYEVDPQAALKASLYLGVSARSTQDQIRKSNAEVVIAAALPSGEILDGSTPILLLSKPSEGSLENRLTWLDSVEGIDLDHELTTITNKPPKLKFTLAGKDRSEFASFLNQLSDSFTAQALD